MAIIEKWKEKLEDAGIQVVVGGHSSPSPRGGELHVQLLGSPGSPHCASLGRSLLSRYWWWFSVPKLRDPLDLDSCSLMKLCCVMITASRRPLTRWLQRQG